MSDEVGRLIMQEVCIASATDWQLTTGGRSLSTELVDSNTDHFRAKVERSMISIYRQRCGFTTRYLKCVYRYVCISESVQIHIIQSL